jgi:hypothetical protein
MCIFYVIGWAQNTKTFKHVQSQEGIVQKIVWNAITTMCSRLHSITNK